MHDSIAKMRQAHKVMAKMKFPAAELDKGFANRWLRIDLDNNKIEIRPLDEEAKRLFTGGKGIDLWLTFQEVNKNTKWTSSENPIVMGSGALGGTCSFPGSGKTLVTAISPLTGSMMDCNVGGYFGPFLKFTGFDALMLIGKAPSETIVFIDADEREVRIERAPKEGVDSHVVAEQLTEMYATNEYERRNISVVSAGKAAENTLIGMLNFSFWDWRRRAVRFKQAGRGGIGTVFRDKKLKALVIKNRDVTPSWSVNESKAARFTALPAPGQVKKAPKAGCFSDRVAHDAAAKFKNDRNFIFDMMRDVQSKEGFLSQAAVNTLNVLTGIPKGKIYAWASFYPEFSLAPRGKKIVQVCSCTACAAAGSDSVLKALEKGLKLRAGQTSKDLKWTLQSVAELGACLAGPVVKIDGQLFDGVTAKDAAAFAKTGKIQGLRKSSPVNGTFRVNGAVARPRVMDAPMGATYDEMVNLAGGPPARVVLKAYQVGGLSGAFVPVAEKLANVDSSIGASSVYGGIGTTAGLTVLDENASMPKLAANATEHLAAASCGKCTACREGLFSMKNTLAKLIKGEGSADDVTFLEEVAETVSIASQCPFGPRAAKPVLSALKYWRHEFDQLAGLSNTAPTTGDAPAAH